MTEQEAIKYMENEISCIQRAKYCDRDCAKCYLVKEDKPLIEAFSIAIQALERAEARRPNIWGDGYDDNGNLIYDSWDCPNCDKTYEVDYAKYDYCPNCGQRIDWSVEE